MTCVEVNENDDVERLYRRERLELLRANKPVVEELVFHGTPTTAVMDQICAGGPLKLALAQRCSVCLGAQASSCVLRASVWAATARPSLTAPRTATACT